MTAAAPNFEGMTEKDQMDTLMAELQDSNMRQSVMEYIANKAGDTAGMSDKERLSKMIQSIAAESVTNKKQEVLWKSRTKKSIFVGIVAVILAITVQFLVNYFSNEVSKESHVKSGTMVAKDGKAVSTESSDTKVNKDGQLTGKAKGAKTIKTTPSLNKVVLASSLPDTTLLALDEVTVYSDKGHTLRIKVHGFARIPVLNSKCGNVVHFYTAWNGRVTLDSTDLSFDKATEAQFKGAGFSLAVGGYSGRRLAGRNKADGFFKHVDKMKKSGAWKCADVPLPTMTETSIRKEVQYRPCTSDICYSSFGGMLPGVALLEKNHALAAMTRTAKIKAIVQKSSTEVYYLKSVSTVYASAKYQMEINTLPQHLGQEEISIFDRTTTSRVTFQVVAGEARSHCVAQATDAIDKSLEKAKSDKSVDSDAHFEFLNTVEEDGKVLRHFRMMTTDTFNNYMNAGGTKPSKGLFIEYWDFSETLTPYRMLDVDGTLTVFESLTPKCSDDDLTKALAKRSSESIADLMTCSKAAKETLNRPTMGSDAYQELTRDGISYYTDKVFGGASDMESAANDAEDKSDKANFARYLRRTTNRMAMPDFCYKICKSVVDALTADLDKAADTCKSGSLKAALNCMETSGNTKCSSSEFYQNHYGECDDGTSLSRRLDEDEEDTETLVPVVDGVADLSKTAPQFQAAISSARLSFNTTSEERRLGDTRQWTSCHSFWLSKRSMNWYWCMQCEFTFRGWGFLLKISWGIIKSQMALSLVCTACLPLEKLWSIPPPLTAKFCISGTLHVWVAHGCPGIWICFYGRCVWKLELGVTFCGYFLGDTYELGIEAGRHYHQIATHCWWSCGEGRRRRRWWSRRRRNSRHCNYRYECEFYVKGWVSISRWIFKVKFELWYWIRSKKLDGIVYIHIKSIWKLAWAKWDRVYQATVFRYYM
jgi:hypothetical protein